MSEYNVDALKQRMEGALKSLMQEFVGLRTGRASVSLLDTVTVDAYGSAVALSQVSSVSVPEPRLISVQVWDKALVSAVDKGIRTAGLGLNPQTDGTLVRVPIPELSEERRKELVKIASKYSEAAKIAVRNVRRDVLELLKKEQKDGKIGEDVAKKHSDDVQKITDDYIKKIDTALKNKETDILKV